MEISWVLKASRHQHQHQKHKKHHQHHHHQQHHQQQAHQVALLPIHLLCCCPHDAPGSPTADCRMDKVPLGAGAQLMLC